MSEKIAKITSTDLGPEDHGIFTASLTVDYGGICQGIGGYSLDTYDDERKGRIGTAFGMEWIRRCLSACGVNSWEKVKGRTVLILFEGDSWNSKPTGIAPLPTEPGKPFIFADLSDEFFPEKAAR